MTLRQNYQDDSFPKVYGYISMFVIFTKGNNFCDFVFASLDDEAHLNRGQLLTERICSFKMGSTFNEKNLLMHEQILSVMS